MSHKDKVGLRFNQVCGSYWLSNMPRTKNISVEHKSGTIDTYLCCRCAQLPSRTACAAISGSDWMPRAAHCQATAQPQASMQDTACRVCLQQHQTKSGLNVAGSYYSSPNTAERCGKELTAGTTFVSTGFTWHRCCSMPHNADLALITG